jgi:hypothetical protein
MPINGRLKRRNKMTYDFRELDDATQRTVAEWEFGQNKAWGEIQMMTSPPRTNEEIKELADEVLEKTKRSLRNGRYMQDGTEVFGPERHDPNFAPVEGINYTAR